MSVARNNAAVFCLFLFVSVSGLLLTGCESPGSVGGSFTDPGTEVRDTVFSVTDVQTDSFTTYSGNLAYFSAGQFNDPLFGNISARSFVKPSLPSIVNSDTLTSGVRMNLRLILQDSAIYGDTLSTAQFDLVEIDEIWRSRALELYDDIGLSQNTVGSFSVDASTDSLDISLGSEWVSRYRAYYNAISANRDSLYLYDFHGLALVPQNESKIIPFDPSESRFVILETDNDTSTVQLSQSAFSLNRSDASAAPLGSSKAISTYEKVLKFDMDLSKEDLGTVNISKVELVFYQNDDLLESSINQVAATAIRPEISSADLYVSNPQSLPELFRTGSPIATANYNKTTGSYRFDITRYTNSVLVDGVSENNSFYITVGSNNGIMKSSLFYNNEALEGKRPKLIVTYINKES